jgi:hypothetical protein
VVFFLGSIYSTLAVAIERYVSVCHPHYVGFSEAGKMAVTGVILFSIVFNINRFFEYKTCYATEVSTFTQRLVSSIGNIEKAKLFPVKKKTNLN